MTAHPITPLHELCAASLAEPRQDLAPAMLLAIEGSFGSLARWWQALLALARPGQSGHLLLSFQPATGYLVNQWVADADAIEGMPLLALRADGADCAAERHDQLAWEQVYTRYQHAVEASSAALAADPAQLGEALVLDVRRAGPFAQAQTMLAGAQWRDPVAVQAWAQDLPRERDILVYCIYGHEVGRATAMKLHALGFKARFLPGGIDAWAAAGRPLQPKTGGPT